MVQSNEVGGIATDFAGAIPILRIFSVEKAREFYLDWLGFRLDWEHRFEPDTPVYMQVSRGALVLHLSEHYGDGTPGVAVLVHTTRLDALHAELTAKAYRYYRPGIERAPWGADVMSLLDPFGNKLRFSQHRGVT